MSPTAHQSDGAPASTMRLPYNTTSGTRVDPATPEPEFRQATANILSNPNEPPPLKKFRVGQWIWVSRSSQAKSESIEARVMDSRLIAGNWMYRLEDKNKRPVWIENPTWIPENQLSSDSK